MEADGGQSARLALIQIYKFWLASPSNAVFTKENESR